jgi:hypothetical protein
MGKISLSIYMKGNYEEFYALKPSKKQSQSKPIRREQIAGHI